MSVLLQRGLKRCACLVFRDIHTAPIIARVQKYTYIPGQTSGTSKSTLDPWKNQRRPLTPDELAQRRRSPYDPPTPPPEHTSSPPSPSVGGGGTYPRGTPSSASSSPSSHPNPSGAIPKDISDNNPVDTQSKARSPEEEMDLGGFEIDPQELKKIIPHGTASRAEVEKAIMEENAEWGGVHWSERNYTAKLGDIVQRQRPDEVKRMLEQSKPADQPGFRKCAPVQAGGPAYPIFFDPNQGGPSRIHASLPTGVEARKGRVTSIHSLHRATNLSFSDCALAYDSCGGEYMVALDDLRKQQVVKLSGLTGHPKKKCKKVFDQCLGDYKKALRKLSPHT